MDEVLSFDHTAPKQMEGSPKNLAVGQLILIGDVGALCHREAYRLSRIRRFHPQTSKGKQIVRRATVAVMGKASETGSTQIDHVL